MYLKAKIECACKCSYEVISTNAHDEIKCPNCNALFHASSDLITLLSAADRISDESSETLTFINVWDNI